MACSDIFAKNLRALLQQFGISSVQLAKAIGVDPSLVSRWRKTGCCGRNANAYVLAIASYLIEKNHSAQNAAWLYARLSEAPLPSSAPENARLALWLYPEADVTSFLQKEDQFSNLLVVNSFRKAVIPAQTATVTPVSVASQPVAAVFASLGTAEAITALHAELVAVAELAAVSIYLSSEAAGIMINRQVIAELQSAVQAKKINIRMLVQSANNSVASSKLVSAYMPLLVSGNLQLSIIQGTPQTFTTTVNIMLPGQAALTITEATQKSSRPVLTTIREHEIVEDMLDNFERSLRFARPMMTAYDDSFARNIIETFFEEYGVPGSLDVIKCGLNPMFMTVEQFRSVLSAFGHEGEQYRWRYLEFGRFKAAMDQVLLDSRFREVLSLGKLREIAQTGRCKMPAMYFMDTGVWYLKAMDCVNVLDGYIEYLERVPNFHVILLEDETLFMPNSCWHIKSNKHIMIHSWDVDQPLMVYSDQMMLIDEFQKHFNHLWEKINVNGSSKVIAIERLKEVRNQCAAFGK